MSSPARFLREYKVVVVGDPSVGKTALTTQFICYHFVDEFDPTFDNDYRKQRIIDGEVALIDVLDTAQGYLVMQEEYIKAGEGFLLLYSITSRSSFEQVASIHQGILNIKGKNQFPIIVVGNKCDVPENERQVTTEEGRDEAKRLGCKFFEASAKQRINVDEAFEELVREIRKYEREALADEPTKGAPITEDKEQDANLNETGCCAGCVVT